MGNGNNNFEDLDAWKQSIELAVSVYGLSKSFPKDELFSLTNQLRRSVSSVSANLAEGYGRYGLKEKMQFYKIANGSLLEAKSFCYLSNKLGYISDDDLKNILNHFITCQKLITALIKSIREKDV